MRSNLKKIFTNINSEKGFVLVEFVIALPLLILLIYALINMILHLTDKTDYAAEYVLESEANEILNRIVQDARAAYSVEKKLAVGGSELEEIFFEYHVIGNDISKEYFKNNAYNNKTTDIVDLIYTRRYTISSTVEHGYYIYAERQKNGTATNPVSGGNLFGDTVVTKLKFTNPSDRVLHITLEMQSVETAKKFKVSTSVFMPACEKMIGF